MKVSKVFKQAKQYLWDGRYVGIRGEEYICHAIEEAARARGIRSQTPANAPYKRAKQIIGQRISPHGTLYGWLTPRVKGAYLVLNSNGGTQQMQAYRHRWLDALIQEFESLGE
jgi:hypothetical protein